MFEIEARIDGSYIRTVQGYTIPGINLDLVLIKAPSEIPVVVHGTNQTAYTSIKTAGLNRMDRNHIHFVHGTPDDETVISGMEKLLK